METQNQQSINPLEIAVLAVSRHPAIAELEDSGRYERCNNCDGLIGKETAHYKDKMPYCDKFCSLGRRFTEN